MFQFNRCKQIGDCHRGPDGELQLHICQPCYQIRGEIVEHRCSCSSNHSGSCDSSHKPYGENFFLIREILGYEENSPVVIWIGSGIILETFHLFTHKDIMQINYCCIIFICDLQPNYVCSILYLYVRRKVKQPFFCFKISNT